MYYESNTFFPLRIYEHMTSFAKFLLRDEILKGDGAMADLLLEHNSSPIQSNIHGALPYQVSPNSRVTD
jgi:hypothetical protein